MNEISKKIAKKILLFGQGTYLNRGCEAIVKSTASNIKRANSSNKITVATFDLEYDQNRHKKLIDKYLNHSTKNDLSDNEKYKEAELTTSGASSLMMEEFYEKEVISEIDKADICLSVGGDNYCYDLPSWLFVIDKKAREKNKKLVLWGASIGEENLNNEVIKDLRKFDVILARESITHGNLSRFIENKRLILCPDPAFSLDIEVTNLPVVFEEADVVGINISPIVTNIGDEGLVLKGVVNLINYILRDLKLSVVLLPHVTKKDNNDLDILKKIKEKFKEDNRVLLIDDESLNCSNLKYIISKCRFLVAARTHASIAGYSTEIPTLVLGYSVKSKGIAKDIFGSYENYVLSVQDLNNEKAIVNKFKFIINKEKEIKNVLEQKMPKFIRNSRNLFETVINRIEELEMDFITKKEGCSGCSACSNICPKKAIEMQEDSEGFEYPFVNKSECINCGLCKKVCPNNKNYNYRYNQIASYACKNKNEKERGGSSSGGLFSALANEILSGGGCVFGAAYVGRDVGHVKIKNKKSLYKIRGSKYVQSSINDCYKEAKKSLELGRKVLFSGVPCQIEGLKNFLQKEYENLLCISVVCHGVPSKKVFRHQIETLKNEYGSDVVDVSFRNKEKGCKNYQIEYKFENKSIKKEIWKDEYMIGFLKNYYLRESCYDCKYRLFEKNTADIILGDFWGIEENHSDFDDNKGVSAVIINSKRGEEFFNRISVDKIYYKKVSLWEIEKGNLCLTDSVLLNEERFNFFDIFDKMGLKFTIDYFVKNEELKKIKNDMGSEVPFIFSKNVRAEQELLEISNSYKWKFVTLLSKYFGFVFPHGTYRRKIIRMSFKGIIRISEKIRRW